MKRKELQEKISKTNRRRKTAVVGLIVGVVLIILGLLSFTLLFIIGFTIFITCTSIISFLTTLKWQYAKILKMEMKEEDKQPLIIECPRCGTRVDRNEKYCSKCGKNVKVKTN